MNSANQPKRKASAIDTPTDIRQDAKRIKASGPDPLTNVEKDAKQTKASPADIPSNVEKDAKKIKDAKSAHPYLGEANYNNLSDEEKRKHDAQTIDKWHADDVATFKKDDKFTAAFADYGVYIVDAFVNSAKIPNLAGYLKCPCVSALWTRFHDNQSVWEVLNELHSEDAKDYPYDLTIKKPSLVRATLFTNLMGGRFKLGDIESTDTPPVSRFPLNQSIRWQLYYLRAALRVMKAIPDSFPGPATPQVSRKYVNGLFEAEDIHRFIILYGKFFKQCVTKSEGKKAKSPGLPRRPVFCLPDEQEKNSERQQALNRHAFESLQRQSRLPFARLSKKEVQGAHLDTVDRSLKEIALSSSLPQLEGDDQRKILEHLAQKVDYLYKDREMRNKFFDPTSQTVDATFRQDVMANKTRSELSKEEQVDFDKMTYTRLQQQIYDCSAKAPDWERTVEKLGLEVEQLGDEEDDLTQQSFRILYRGLQLMPWQPQAVMFMLDMIEGPLRGAINSDDMGLGKTISTYAVVVERSIRKQAEIYNWQAKSDAIYHSYRASDGADEAMMTDPEISAAYQRELDALGPKPRHRPVLIVVPLSAINTWTSDAADHFSAPSARRDVTLKIFYGKSDKRNGSLSDDLTAWCGALDPDAETTSRTCVLSTFRSYSVRCLSRQNGDGTSAPVEAGPSASDNMDIKGERQDKVVDDAVGDIDVVEETEDAVDDAAEHTEEAARDAAEQTEEAAEDAVEETEETLTLTIPSDLFALVVIDEAHYVKNPKSRQAIALYSLSECAYILCTATPCINSVRDLYGLLRFFWKAVVKIAPKRRPNQQSYADWAKSFRQDYDRNFFQISSEDRGNYLAALDPEHYKTMLGSGSIDTQTGRDVVPLPLMLTCLKRVKGHTITVAGHTIQLGAEIPPPQITLVEVRNCDDAAGRYNAAHQDCIEYGKAGGDGNEGDEQRPSNVRRRRLQHAALCPLLEQMFCRNVGNNAQEIEQFLRGTDSFTAFHLWTVSDAHHPEPKTRIDMAQWIAGISPKLQALCAEILQVIVKEGNKLLIYADWPLNLWLIELLLSVLQIKYVSIRAGVSTNRRIEAENEYNNNDTIKALVCSSRSAAESLNLQKGGWHTVIMDMIPINTILQIVGRTSRVGQRFAQQIKVFIADETHDQYLVHKYLTDYITQVAATSDLQIPENEQERIDNKVSATAEAKTVVDQDTYREVLTQRLKDAYSGALACSILGARCTPTLEWSNVRDVYEKNISPEQQLFRLAGGGVVADEMLQQLQDHKIKEKKLEERKLEQQKLEQQKLEEQKLEEQEMGEQEVADQEQQSRTQAADRPPTALRTTPFAAAILARPINRGGFSRRRHVWALIHAASDMANDPAYLLKMITAKDCLEAAKTWVECPSPAVDLAIAQLDRPEDGGDADGYLSESSTIAEEEEADDDDIPTGEATGEPIMMAHRPRESGKSEENDQIVELDIPQSAADLTPEQVEAYEQHLKAARSLRSKPEVSKFAQQEFEVTVQGSRKDCDSAIALLWIQKEIHEKRAHTPIWSDYQLKGKGKGKKQGGEVGEEDLATGAVGEEE